MAHLTRSEKLYLAAAAKAELLYLPWAFERDGACFKVVRSLIERGLLDHIQKPMGVFLITSPTGLDALAGRVA